MKIPETGRTTAPRRVEPAAPSARRRPSEARTIADTASVMGIPVEELTPKVRDAIMRLMAEVDRLRGEVEQQKARIGRLETLADQDALAPVFNRRAFVRDLSRVLSSSERYGEESSVIYFDLNGLKAINDTHGHAAGDAALVKVADLLLANVRESDSVGRLGGDEFGVILTRASHEAAAEKARALARLIEDAAFDWNGSAISLTVAWGVHTFAGGDEPGSALAAADRAMYSQKRGKADE